MLADITSLGFLSSTTTAFLNKESRLTDIIGENHCFCNIDNAINGKANFGIEKRKILVDTIQQQYMGILKDEDVFVKQNIQLLLQEDTYTVTTGQQLHLFLGPVFMVYKLISTIKAAEYYKNLYPNKNFVPIFWLASEDHDFDEIKDTVIFGERYTWQTNQGGATGNYHLEDLPQLFQTLRTRFEKDEKTLKLISTFEEFYTSSDNLAIATIKVAHHFFSEYGIVCIDANCKALKTLFASVIKDELILENNYLIFNETSNLLKENNLSLQLKARKVNLFYLENGERNRIEKTENGFHIVGSNKQFSNLEIMNLVESNPERFSPNAVLRPLYQETILPNIAYIGGNAEINYWIQLANVFKQCKINAPHLVLRQSIWYISVKNIEFLNKHKIEFTTLFKANKTEDFIQLIDDNSKNLISEYIQQFETLKTEIQNEVAKSTSAELKQIVELGKMYEKGLKNIEQKYQIFLSDKNQNSIKKILQIKALGFDKNNIQERVIFSIEMMLKVENLTKNVYESVIFEPLKASFFVH